jgi:hypothetical protein
MIGISASLASIYYLQPVKYSIFAVRHLFYYCAFFVFLLMFDKLEEIYIILDIVSVLAFIAVVLSVVNYFGPTIFYHQWAEGHSYRAGIERAFIPGMDLVSLAIFWQVVKWLEKIDSGIIGHRSACFLSIVFLGALFFRQTRSRIVAVSFVLIGLLALKGRLRVIISFTVIVFVAWVVMEFHMRENIMSSSYTGVVEDISEKKGTWDDRIEQIEIDVREFFKFPILGNAAAAIRISPYTSNSARGRELAKISKMDDLGYTHWMKSFGIVGMVWLALFFAGLWSSAFKAFSLSSENNRSIALMCLSYLLYVMISFVTLNHLILPRRILPLCLIAALSQRLIWNSQICSKEDSTCG